MPDPQTSARVAARMRSGINLDSINETLSGTDVEQGNVVIHVGQGVQNGNVDR